MQRRLGIIFTLMLIFQMITPVFAAPLTTYAKGNDSIFTDVILDDEEAKKTTATVKWTIAEEKVGDGDIYSLDLREGYEIEEQQTGDLKIGEQIVGSYETEGNSVKVIFNETIADHDNATGEFAISMINVAVIEAQQAEKEKEIKEEADTEQTEDAKTDDDEAFETTKDKQNKETDEENDADETSESDDNNDTAEIEEEKEDNEEEAKKETTDREQIEDAETNQEKASKKPKDKQPKKNSANTMADNEKYGFNLELGKVTDLEGIPYGEDNLLNPQDEFKLKLDWNLDDSHDYKAGDTETFDLPKGIKIQEEIKVELKDNAGQIVANAVITTDKQVQLTFTEFVETHSNINGWMEIISTLDEEEVEVEDGEAILEPIEDEGEIRIPIEEVNKNKTIEKKGTPNKSYNGDEINWEVIINKNKTSLNGAKVTDALPKGTEYKEGSLKVTKLKVDLNGNILGDIEEVDVTGETVKDSMLNIPLDDIKSAYRIEYTTKVTDDEEKSFKNNATLTDDELEDISADATVTINRGEPIKKKAAKGYNPKTGTIEWEIEFNYNQKKLENVTLKDAWTPTGKMHLVEDSLKFQEVTIDENGKTHNQGEAIQLPDGAKLENGDDQFEVTDISTDKAYKVTYQTKVNDRVLDGFDVKNTAGFGAESDGTGAGIGSYYGSKSAGTVDYKNKTIDWKIEINHDEYPMEKISIVDTLGEGLTLLKDSIQITVDGKHYTGDFTLSGDNPFTIDFPEKYTTDKKIEITYMTEFDADIVPNHKPTNKAAITWTPEGEDDSITKEVKAETELNKETKDSSWKNGTYNPETKEITWIIYTNYRENNIADLIVKDKPQGNQKIVKNSAIVKELDIAENGNFTEGDSLNDSVATINEDANTLEVNIGKTNKAYKIEYKTSLEGLSDIQKEYVNKAEIFDSDDSLSEVEAKVGIAKAHTYGAKSGYQDGKQVHWTVTVNPGQQKVKNLKLEDTVSDNQDILTDTFKVYEATVDNNGNATKGVEVPADKYELSYSEGDPTFTVKWNETVERAFIVEYSTLFFEKHNGDVTNSYNVTGDNIVKDGKTDGDGSVTIKQLGSGGGSGEAGYLVIDKVDSTYGKDEKKLSNATFDLIDPDTGKVLKSGTTDENGQIDFGRLLFGNYQLKETKVPEGYVTPNEEQTITIDKAYEPGDDKEAFEYTVENYEPVFAIELSKTDDEDNALKDAEFTLFDSNDNEVAKTVTNKDGKILFEDLEGAGTYYVQETKAPTGYVLDNKKHEVKVGEKEKEPVKLKVENASRGAVQLTKIDKDTRETLENVEFVLQQKNESGEYKTIKTYVTDENGQIRTSNKLEAGEYQFVETKALDGYRTNGKPVRFKVKVNSKEDQKYTMENEQYKGSLKLKKKDAATKEALKDAAFKLVDSEGKTVKENLITNDEGVIVVNDLFLGNYQLIETKAPSGYELDETPINIDITKDKQVAEKTMMNNKITDISVEKKWNNNGSDTKPVTVKLLPTDETIELNKDNDWKATFKDLDVYDEAGKAIDYQVEELELEGYNSAITGDALDGFIVTNTETINVSGTKTWQDDESDERPDTITVNLLADGEKVDNVKVTAGSDWKYEFTDLDKYNEDGDEISYTIDESKMEGYETTIDGFNITNTRVGTTSVKGEKTWKDEDPTDRPESITVNLSREIDGKVDKDFSESKEVKPDNSGKWTYIFTDLDKFNENGTAYTYTIKEDNVPDSYESIIEGYDITNVRVGKTDISGTKRWKDDKIEDRPDSIKVNLLQNDVVIDTKEVKADNNWKYTFADLDKYDKEGKLYHYTVKEQYVPGYDSKVNSHDITNTRSEKISIDVTKGWLDDDSKDRPESVIVYLKQNGKLFDTVEIKNENDWAYTFTDLEAYDDEGKPYSYTVEEKALEGYKTEINGFDITNLRVGETEVTGTKTWLDDESDERPEFITVKLLANGKETDQSIKVTAEDNWKYEFTALPKYDDQGKEITYSIDEKTVEGYDKFVDGHDIVNLRTGKTEISGEKNWVEVDEQYRPETITVNLLANGEIEDTVEVSKKTDWVYTFTDLAKYDEDGKEIDYTIEEVEVPGYTSKVDGYNITNTQIATEVSGEKTWLDDNSKDRPKSITVNLLANDKETEESAKVTAEENWMYTFTNLPKYDDKGKKITYSVDEVDVDGYKKSIKDNDITNLRTGKTAVDVTKLWKDDNKQDRPDTIKVNLLQNGNFYNQYKVTVENDWKLTVTDLPKYDENGVAYKYSVTEHDVPGYSSEVNGFEITNTRKDVKSINITKTWLDDQSDKRPDSIEVELFRSITDSDPELVNTITLTNENDWNHEVTDLPAFDHNGKAYTYEVQEKPVVGYKTSINGFELTNLRIGKTKVSGTKTWLDDGPDERPDAITVKLLANGEETGKSIEVTAEDNWKYAFTDLDKFDNKGKEIAYSVDEKDVKGYEKSFDGNNITNLRAEKTEVSGEKVWLGDNSEDRPKSIKVNLLQNGEKIATKKVTAGDNWKYTFNNLDKYDSEGKSYNYTVEEKTVAGYKSTIDGFDITNELILGTVELTKVDKNDTDKKLQDAGFEVQDKDGNVIESNLTTDGNGKISLELPPGHYQFVETKAPSGYRLDETPMEFTIVLGQTETITLEMKNTKLPNSDGESPPSTGPEDPENPDPKKPDNPVKNTEGSVDSLEISDDKDDSTVKSVSSIIDNGTGGGDSKTDQGAGKTLPNTATNMLNLMLIGFFLLSLGLILIYVRKKKEA